MIKFPIIPADRFLEIFDEVLGNFFNLRVRITIDFVCLGISHLNLSNCGES